MARISKEDRLIAKESINNSLNTIGETIERLWRKSEFDKDTINLSLGVIMKELNNVEALAKTAKLSAHDFEVSMLKMAELDSFVMGHRGVKYINLDMDADVMPRYKAVRDKVDVMTKTLKSAEAPQVSAEPEM